MSTITTFPNGEVLTSSALTSDEMDTIIQALVCACLGIPLEDSANDTRVKTSWPTGGQPGFLITDNVVFIQCAEEPDDYNTTRNEDVGDVDVDGETVSVVEQYTRVWSVSLEFRGPTSFDDARLVRSAIQRDWAHDTLAVSSLYLRPNVGSPRRAPELEDGQWWERTNLELFMNEDVKESVSVSTVATAEVITATQSGVDSDRVVSVPIIPPVPPPTGFGDGGFGEGQFQG